MLCPRSLIALTIYIIPIVSHGLIIGGGGPILRIVFDLVYRGANIRVLPFGRAYIRNLRYFKVQVISSTIIHIFPLSTSS